MAQYPYRIARQEHIGDMLDEFQNMGLVGWRFYYDSHKSTAYYYISVANRPEDRYDTKSVEVFVQNLCDREGIIWRPVPHPGGEEQRNKIQAWIASHK